MFSVFTKCTSAQTSTCQLLTALFCPSLFCRIFHMHVHTYTHIFQGNLNFPSLVVYDLYILLTDTKPSLILLHQVFSECFLCHVSFTSVACRGDTLSYHKLSPNRVVFYSVEVSDTSFSYKFLEHVSPLLDRVTKSALWLR